MICCIFSILCWFLSLSQIGDYHHLKLGCCFSGIIKARASGSKVYLYFMKTGRQARHRIPRNSCYTWQQSKTCTRMIALLDKTKKLLLYTEYYVAIFLFTWTPDSNTVMNNFIETKTHFDNILCIWPAYIPVFDDHIDLVLYLICLLNCLPLNALYFVRVK